MQNVYARQHEYTEEEMQEIKAENCKTHGQRQQEAQDHKCFNVKASLILIGIFAIMYFLMPIIENAMLG